MDLLATVRKEGSRGGRNDFKWSDVQNSSHREHYLGHSLMAPVGRWAKGRDLNWYAKSDAEKGEGVEEDPDARAARERKEEIKRIKEAEQDALARALGLPVAPKNHNANLEPLGDKKDVDDAIREAVGVGDSDEEERGVGFGAGRGGMTTNDKVERIEGNAESQDRELQYALREYRRRRRDEDGGGVVDAERSHKRQSERSDRERSHRHRHRHRSGSRDRDRDRDRDRRTRRASRSRSRSRDRNHRNRRRDRPRTRSRSRSRSRSPVRRRNDRERYREPNRDRRRDGDGDEQRDRDREGRRR